MTSFASVLCNGHVVGNIFDKDITGNIKVNAGNKSDDLEAKMSQSKYTFLFTGKHDHGEMPQLRSNEFDGLVKFLTVAKTTCGEALSKAMEAKKSGSKAKRQRLL